MPCDRCAGVDLFEQRSEGGAVVGEHRVARRQRDPRRNVVGSVPGPVAMLLRGVGSSAVCMWWGHVVCTAVLPKR